MRQTLIYRDGKMVPKAPQKRKAVTEVMMDTQPFLSPVDFKTEITSRSQVRELERKHGIRQVGNDYPGSEKPQFWDDMVAKSQREG